MYLALTSLSSDADITRPLLERIAEALEFQLHAHYGPFWQAAGVPVKVFSTLDAVPDEEGVSPLVVFDDPDQAGVLGWHTVSPQGRSYGRAFWNVIRRNGGTMISGANSLSQTLSHEALEMVGNPYVNFWADLAFGQEAIELCDRVEADSYEIGGVAVSNFLGPRAFRDGPGPYDWMRLLSTPWEIRPGGYAIQRDVSGEIVEVYGKTFPDWKKNLKRAEGSRMMRRRSGSKGDTE